MQAKFSRLRTDEQAVVMQMLQGACDALTRAGVTVTNKSEPLEKFKENCADLYVSSLTQGDYRKAMEVADRLGIE